MQKVAELERIRDHIIDKIDAVIDEIELTFDLRSGPIVAALDLILKKYGIVLSAHHGRCFVGNYCIKYLSEEVYTPLTATVQESMS